MRRGRWRPALRRLAVVALLVPLAVAVGPAPAEAAAPVQKGIQFGQALNVENCSRNPATIRFLADPGVLAKTSWVRIDLRGAGGDYSDHAKPYCATLATAYQQLFAAIRAAAPQIQIIGLLSHDFVWGGTVGVSPQRYGDQIYAAACDARYLEVDVWEVWNEPNMPPGVEAGITAQAYGDLLEAASFAVDSCNRPGNIDKVISGGLLASPDTIHAVLAYLLDVDTRMGVNGIGHYASLAEAIDGLGMHPYLSPVDMETFLLDLYDDLLDFDVKATFYLTEFGWAVGDGGMNEPLQCQWLIDAFSRIAQHKSEIPAATFFTLTDFGFADKRFGLYDDYGNARPARNGYITNACVAVPPIAPGDLQVWATSPTSVMVSWADRSFNESGFLIRSGSTVQSAGGGILAVPFVNLTPGTTHCFTVESVNGSGSSPRSLPRCAATPAAGTPPQPPATPGKPVVTATSPTSVHITWQDNSGTADRFWIDTTVETHSEPGNHPWHDWNGLTPGLWTCFHIIAINAAGYSSWSEYTCLYMPTA
ncbi:hypothetical protein F4553_007338 [Allocatelliglobosispora scoriae]|uniref:Fibronectin type-III domain-containing protein n=1 Tax=Allocatelliglobosispora scoriae TaxID=643052 RepID=A0A841C0K3_9ACTN|nr:fibronectin type III domain-containing protein [Allocatelliglobosispora scoriae]MBB5873904.1 hypothetical protein [Allocatelliglobosispora scoriae]